MYAIRDEPVRTELEVDRPPRTGRAMRGAAQTPSQRFDTAPSSALVFCQCSVLFFNLKLNLPGHDGPTKAAIDRGRGFKLLSKGAGADPTSAARKPESPKAS